MEDDQENSLRRKQRMADGSQQSLLLLQPENGDTTTAYKRIHSKLTGKNIVKVVIVLATLTIVACLFVYYGAPFGRGISGLSRSIDLVNDVITKNCSMTSSTSNQKPECCKLNVSVGDRATSVKPSPFVIGKTDCERGHKWTQRLPQAIIIGARKGGTRALLAFLQLNSAIITASEEVHFFDRDENYSQGIDSYKDCMPFTNCGQITMEKTPGYFTEKKVPERVHKMNSSVKLILVLRDPTERAISDYLQLREKRYRKGLNFESFEELAIKERTGEVRVHYSALQRSLYHIYLGQWLQYFSRDQIMILCSEDLVADPASELRTVETFLKVRHEITPDDFYFNETKGFYCIAKKHGSGCLSKSKGRPHPYFDEKVIQKLRDFFRPHNRILYKMMGKDCGWP